jgi:tetratricopeptide (TPR) repeat protein
MSKSKEGAGLPWPENGQSAADRLEAVISKGGFPEAKERLELEIRVKEVELGPGHPETVMALLELGNVLMCLDDAKGAARVAWRAVKAAGGKGGTGPGSHASIVANSFLGAALNSLGRPDEAERILKRAFEAAMGNLGPGHPDTLECANALAGELEDRGLASEGEAVLSDALEGVRGHPEDHGSQASKLRCNLAALLIGRGDMGGAEELLRPAHVDLTRLRGPYHPHTLFVANNLASVLLGLGEADQAVALYKEVLKGMSRFPPRNQSLILQAMDSLARAEAQAGKGGGGVN